MDSIYVIGSLSDVSMNIYGPTTASNPNPGSVLTLTKPSEVSQGYDGFVINYDSFGNPQWANLLGSDTFNNAVSITSDINNNIYVSGQFSDVSMNIYGPTTVSNPNPGSVLTLTKPSEVSQGTGGFVIKYDSSGNPQWANKVGSYSTNYTSSITSDINNNIYVLCKAYDVSTNIYGPTTVSNPNPGCILTLTSPSGLIGQLFGIVIKYDLSGNPQWANKVGSESESYTELKSTTSDTNNNIYVSGVFSDVSMNIYGPTTVSNPNPGIVLTLTNPSGLSQFMSGLVIKYDSSGNPQWANKVGPESDSYTELRSTTSDINNNIYVSGLFSDVSMNIYGPTTVSNPNPGIVLTLTNPSGLIRAYSGFVIKYDSSGNPQWANKVGSDSISLLMSTTSDINNDIYVSGVFSDVSINIYGPTTVSNPNPGIVLTLTNPSGLSRASSGLVIKYDSFGNPQWATQIGYDSTNYTNSITSDINNNIYVSGQFNNSLMNIYGPTTVSNPNPGVVFTLNTQFIVNYTIKYNKDGVFQWANKMNTGYFEFDSLFIYSKNYKPDPPDAPILAPNPIVPPVPNETVAKLLWFPYVERGSPVTGYRVLIIPSAGSAYTYDFPNPQDTSGSFITGVIPFLIFGRTYRFKIAANSDVGYSAYSLPTDPPFSLIGAPFPPTRVYTGIVAPGANNSLQASIPIYWTQPAGLNGSTLYNYSIEATVNDVPQNPVIVTPDTMAAYTLQYAFYGDTYSFRVKSNSNYGSSEWSILKSPPVTIAPGLPNVPTIFAPPSKDGSNEVTVYWNEPVSNGSNITSHTLLIQNTTTNTTTTINIPV